MQVVSPVAEEGEGAPTDGRSTGPHTGVQQQMQEESEYEPTAVEKVPARKLVKHVGNPRAAAMSADTACADCNSAAAADADEEDSRGTKVSMCLFLGFLCFDLVQAGCLAPTIKQSMALCKCALQPSRHGCFTFLCRGGWLPRRRLQLRCMHIRR